MIGDRIVARTCRDHIGATAAVNRIGPRASGDRVGGCRSLHIQGCRQDARVDVFEIGDIDSVARGLVGSRRHREVDGGDAARRCKHQRVAAGTAIDGDFRAVVGNRVVSGARRDDIGATGTVDRVRPRAARDDIGRRRTGDGNAGRHSAGIDILEVRHIDTIATGLVGRAEVDGGGRIQDQGVGAGATIDGDFRTVVEDRVVAGARRDRIRAAPAIDQVIARAGRDRVGEGAARDTHGARQCARIEVLEIEDCDRIAGRLVGPGGNREVDGGNAARGRQDQGVGSRATVDHGFRSVIGHGVVAGAGIDRIRAAAAVDGVGSGTGDDRVRRGRAGDAQGARQDAGIEAFEIADRNRVAHRLVGAGGNCEIDSRDARPCREHQHVAARPAIDACFGPVVGDGVVAGAGCDDVGAAVAVDRVGAGAARDGIGSRGTGDRDAVGQGRGIDVLETGDAGEIARRLVHIGQIDDGVGLQHQGIGARAAVDGRLGAVIGDRVIAGTGRDDVGAAAAVDGVGPRAGGDRVGTGRAGHCQRARQDTGVDALEIADGNRIARGLIGTGRHGEVHRRDAGCCRKHQQVVARTAIDGDFRAMVGDRVVAATRRNDIRTPGTVNRVGAHAAGNDVRAGRASDIDGLARGQPRSIDILEPRHCCEITECLIGSSQTDRRSRFQNKRVCASATVDRDFRTPVIDGIVASAGGDDIGATATVNGIGARASGD